MKCPTLIDSAPSPAAIGSSLSAPPANAGRGRKAAYRSRFVATHFATRTEYQEFRQNLTDRLDNMKIDEVIRVNNLIAPSQAWVCDRAKLNNYVVTVRNVDEQQIWIRLK